MSTKLIRAEKLGLLLRTSLSAAQLTDAEFHAAVHTLAPRVAVFDCDGTLWSGDAGSTFMTWSIERGMISREAMDWIDGQYRSYKRGEVSEEAICGQMVQVYEGLREEEMRRAASDFFRARIERNIFPEMKQLVADLQRGGTEIWAVSSTCDWVIEEGVRRFGIAPERVLAARVEVVDGVVTNRLVDVPTDEAKVAALARVGVSLPDAVFGNSIHDAAMLGVARGAFPVNPSPELVERSVEAGWRVYYPAAVRPG